LIAPLLDSVVIAPAFETPAPPAPALKKPPPPVPPRIVPLFVSVVIVLAFDTPAPPGADVPPVPPLIFPPDWLVSVVIAQATASTPSGPPEISPLLVTVMAPPLLTTGPATGPEMVWREGAQAARTVPGAPSVARVSSEAPASSAGRVFLKVGGKDQEEEFVEFSRPPSRAGRTNL
jgi:hypothetical protein